MRLGGARRRCLLVAAAVSLVACGLSWASAAAQEATPTPNPAPTPCPAAVPVTKPTGLAGKVNPAAYPDGTVNHEDGILLTWDPAPAAEQVNSYDVYGREATPGTTLRLYGNIANVGFYNPRTGTSSYVTDAPMDFFIPATAPPAYTLLEDGKSYVFRVQAIQSDNQCIDHYSERSDAITVAYTAPVSGDSGNNDQTGGI